MQTTGDHTTPPSWLIRLLRRRTGRASGLAPSLARALRAGRAAPAFDALESRLVLAGSPLPTLSQLESPGNTVVRFETNFGDVDIELFDGAAPVSVANFLNYVTSGRYEDTFFHRRARAADSGVEVLQGGAFAYKNDTGLDVRRTDAPIIRETTGRSNLERTIAMARTNAINTATNQFYFNTSDNVNLDPTGPNNGFAVFGRVIQGWSIVLTMASLDIADLSGDPALSDIGSAVSNVPVTTEYSPVAGVREAALARVVNAEIVKPASLQGFYSSKTYFPDGYRSGGSVETVELVNPNTVAVSYQIIARYEDGDRESVVASGSVAAGTAARVRLSDFRDSNLTLVRTETPYALVVESGAPESAGTLLPLAASIRRDDFNAATGEEFFNAAGYSSTQLLTWDFARIERGPQSREFLTWQSLSDRASTVTVTVTTSIGPQSFVLPLDAYRRGGLDLSLLGLEEGAFSARVSSTLPIVAALSDFDLGPANVPIADAYAPGWSVLGTPDGGSTSGGTAGAEIRDGFTNLISITNQGAAPADVTLRFWRTDRAPGDAPITRVEPVFGGGRVDYVLDAVLLGLPVNTPFTVTYDSGSAPVTLQYTAFANTGRNEATGIDADGVSTRFGTRLAPAVHFAGGELDPARNNATQVERVSLFNPFTVATITFTYTVRFTFDDGTVIDGASGTLGPSARVDVVVGEIGAVRAKAASAARFRTYAISVVGQGIDSGITQAAPLTQFTRFDTVTGRSVSAAGMESAIGLRFTDEVFAGGIDT